MQQQRPTSSYLVGYRPIWERRPDLFPNGAPTGQQQQRPSGNSQVAAGVGQIGGMVAGQYVGANAAGWLGLGGAGTASTAGAGVAGTAGAGAAGAGAGTVAGAGAGAGLGAAAAGAGVAAAMGYGAYRIADQYGNRKQSGSGRAQAIGKGAAVGAAAGSVVPVVGTAIGAVVGPLYGGIMASAGSGKSAQQMGRRDPLRKQMQQFGLMDDNWNVFGTDLGKDGGFRFDDGSRVYEAYAGQEEGTGEPTEEEAELIADMLVAGQILGGGDEINAGYANGMLVNAIKRSDGDKKEKVRQVYDSLGGYHVLFNEVARQANEGELDLERAQVMQLHLNNHYTEEERNAPPPEQQQSLTDSIMGGFDPNNPWSYFGMQQAPQVRG